MAWLERILGGILSLLTGDVASGLDGRVAFLLGLGIAVVMALVVFRVRIWWMSAVAVVRPQRVFHATDRSPWQVFWASAGALLRIIGMALLIAGILLMLFLPGDPLAGAIVCFAGILVFLLGWWLG